MKSLSPPKRFMSGFSGRSTMLHSGTTASAYVDSPFPSSFSHTNRLKNHSASYGFSGHRRHAVRVACHGERPFLDLHGKSQEEELNALHGSQAADKDGSRQSNYND